jgi:hypothetical protein
MDEFNHGRKGIAFLSTVTTKGRRGEKKERPESLSATADDIVDDFRDEVHFGTEIHFHVLFHKL